MQSLKDYTPAAAAAEPTAAKPAAAKAAPAKKEKKKDAGLDALLAAGLAGGKKK